MPKTPVEIDAGLDASGKPYKILRYPDLKKKLEEEWKQQRGHWDASDRKLDQCILHSDNRTQFRELIGVLDALTDREQARFVRNDQFGRQAVEPMTNYFVSRATKDLGSEARIGVMLTSVERRLPYGLPLLPRPATTCGLDLFLQTGSGHPRILGSPA